MFPKKSPIRGPLLIIVLVISIFAFTLYSENRITGMAPAEFTGDIVKITGMQTATEGVSTFNNPIFKAQDESFLTYQATGSDGKTYTIQLFKAQDLKGTARIYKNSYEENLAKGFNDNNPNYIWSSGATSELYTQTQKALTTVNSENVAIDWWYTNPQITTTPTQPTTTSTTTTPTGTQTITTTPTYDYKVIINGQTVIQEDVALDEATFRSFAQSQGWTYVGKATTQEVTSQTGNEYRVTQGSTTFLVKGDSLQSVKNIYPTAEVEESSYKITYNSQSITVPYYLKEQEIATLKALGISYTATPVTGIEAASAQELKNYEIKLADGTTVNKMFVDDNAAQQFIDSIENSLIGYGATYTRKISDEEAKKYGYTNSGYTLSDGKVLFTKDGKTFYQDPTINNPTAYSGTLYKSYTIGLDKSVKVSEYYTIQPNAQPKFEYATINNINIKIPDRATLNEIKASIGSKGTVIKEGNLIVTKRDNQPYQAFDISPDYNLNEKKGFKTIISYDNAYIKDGRVISKSEFNTLSEEEKTEYQLVHMVASVKGEGWSGREHIAIFGETRIRDGKLVYEGQGFNDNGEVVMFYYREGWTYNDVGTSLILNKDGDPVDIYGQKLEETQLTEAQKILLSEARNRQQQAASRKWFSDFRFRLTQFQGLSGWSQFIFSDEFLADWREGVDKLFSTLYLGTEYWVSEICSKDIPKQKRGMFMMETNDGLFDVIAHVEGEKTAIPGPDKTEYIYKLTLAVRNPKNSRYEKLKFNVYLVRDKEVQLYPQYLEVEDGDSFTRGEGQREGEKVTYDKQHGPPIVQYSPYNYNQICIRFEQDIINAKGEPQREICNKIVEYQGPTTGYQQPSTTGESGRTSGPAGDQYQEADF